MKLSRKSVITPLILLALSGLLLAAYRTSVSYQKEIEERKNRIYEGLTYDESVPYGLEINHQRSVRGLSKIGEIEYSYLLVNGEEVGMKKTTTYFSYDEENTHTFDFAKVEDENGLTHEIIYYYRNIDGLLQKKITYPAYAEVPGWSINKTRSNFSDESNYTTEEYDRDANTLQIDTYESKHLVATKKILLDRNIDESLIFYEYKGNTLVSESVMNPYEDGKYLTFPYEYIRDEETNLLMERRISHVVRGNLTEETVSYEYYLNGTIFRSIEREYLPEGIAVKVTVNLYGSPSIAGNVYHHSDVDAAGILTLNADAFAYAEMNPIGSPIGMYHEGESFIAYEYVRENNNNWFLISSPLSEEKIYVEAGMGKFRLEMLP